MSTREFKQLEKNIEALRRQFLSFDKRVNGKYTRSELLNCRAFVAFAHAEVEHYLESVATRILARAKKKWREDRRVSIVSVALLAFKRRAEVSTPEDATKPGDKQTVDFLLMDAIHRQEIAIKRNDGIKPPNVSSMYVPLGIRLDASMEPLMIQLKNFGAARGGLVHNNSQVSLKRIRDPFDDEYKDVEFLLTELRSFDALTQALQ